MPKREEKEGEEEEVGGGRGAGGWGWMVEYLEGGRRGREKGGSRK